MNCPEKISIANLPTKIEKLETISELYGKNIYIKRDDQTGMEISGNKIRKLEYSLKEAVYNGVNYIITCGSIQSNHARATVVSAMKLGLKVCLVLKGKEDSVLEGNYFFDRLLGAEIKLISGEDYANNRSEIMNNMKLELENKGHKAYIIPEGASNAIGSFGYVGFIDELMTQEKDMGIKFDAAVVTVGSCGTYSGLVYGNEIYKANKDIIGINICDTADYFKDKALNIIDDMNEYTKEDIMLEKDELMILDGHAGKGYAISQKDEIEFIKNFAESESIILDPVYTGKAMYGFIKELKAGTFDRYENILFIHTGGIFGWTEEARNMIKDN